MSVSVWRGNAHIALGGRTWISVGIASRNGAPVTPGHTLCATSSSTRCSISSACGCTPMTRSARTPANSRHRDDGHHRHAQRRRHHRHQARLRRVHATDGPPLDRRHGQDPGIRREHRDQRVVLPPCAEPGTRRSPTPRGGLREGHASLYDAGGAPGFISEVFPIAATMMERRLDLYSVVQYANVSKRKSPEMIKAWFGGDPTPSTSPRPPRTCCRPTAPRCASWPTASAHHSTTSKVRPR